MSDRANDFTGRIPHFYDHGLGPVFFVDFADDIARRAAAAAPMRLLELAAGTGIVTRRLRDLLPRDARLIATDLNPPMLEVARGKFRADEAVEINCSGVRASANACRASSILIRNWPNVAEPSGFSAAGFRRYRFLVRG